MTVMSLNAFQTELSQLSAVKGTLRLDRDHTGDEQMLQVFFEGEPADYSSRISALKSQYGIKQIEPERDVQKRTADGMPVLYFASR